MRTGSLKEMLESKARDAKPKCKHYFTRMETGTWICTVCDKTPKEIWKK